ncbi:MAG: peptidoglycan-binding protein [Alphaproteobacteria bacterium]
MSEDPELSSGPIGTGDWTVEPGDSMASIADQTGHYWQTIWDDPANQDLKKTRENPETLLAGDKVTVPSLREKKEKRETDLIHTFKRRGIPIKVAFTVKEQGKDGTVFANKAYVLRVGKRRYEGRTDSDGKLEQWVSPAATEGKLTVELDEEGYPESYTWILKVGQVPPIDTMYGIQWRLKNLGYDCGKLDGEASGMTRAALSVFQSAHGLEETGDADQQTRDKIEEVHGS